MKEKKWKSQFEKSIKIRKSQDEWIIKNKDTRTKAGYLDKIINHYRKHNADNNTKNAECN